MHCFFDQEFVLICELCEHGSTARPLALIQLFHYQAVFGKCLFSDLFFKKSNKFFISMQFFQDQLKPVLLSLFTFISVQHFKSFCLEMGIPNKSRKPVLLRRHLVLLKSKQFYADHGLYHTKIICLFDNSNFHCRSSRLFNDK